MVLKFQVANEIKGVFTLVEICFTGTGIGTGKCFSRKILVRSGDEQATIVFFYLFIPTYWPSSVYSKRLSRRPLRCIT